MKLHKRMMFFRRYGVPDYEICSVCGARRDYFVNHVWHPVWYKDGKRQPYCTGEENQLGRASHGLSET